MAGAGTQIGAINVAITATTGKLSSQIKKAKAELSGFGQHVAAHASAIRSGLSTALGIAAAGATAAGAALVALGKNQADQIIKARDFSKSIGATTLGYSRLQHAARKSADVETLDAALKNQVKTLGEAVNGSKTARQAFSALGLSFVDLASMPTDKAFAKIIGQLQKIPNHAQRAARAQDIFGKSAAGLANLISEGSEGLAAAASEADRLRLSFSAVDAEQVKQAGDAVAQIKFAVQGLGNYLAIEFAPIVEMASNKLSEMFSRDGQERSIGLVDAMRGSVGLLVDSVQVLGIAWEHAKFQTLNTGAAIAKVVEMLGGGSFLTEELNAAAANQIKAVMDASNAPWWSDEIQRQAEASRAKARRNGTDRLATPPQPPGQSFDFSKVLGLLGKFFGGALASVKKTPLPDLQSVNTLIEGKQQGTIEAFRAVEEKRGKRDEIPKKQLAAQNKGNQIAQQMLVKLGQFAGQASNATVITFPR